LEYLSDASFLGKLLAFPPNVRLEWKVITSYKHSSVFGLVDSDDGKKFYDNDTRLSELGYEVRLRGPVLREPGLQLGALGIKVLLHKLRMGKMKHISNKKI
jgi:hypothetical protein